MFIPKCKKCGGKVISAYTNIEIETNGVLKTVTNTPAKKCSKCGHIIVDDITMEKAKQYANDYPANTIDYGKIRNSKTSRYSVRNVGKKP